MGSGIFGISVTGLNAAQAAIRTIQHNISNANTDGYHRQEVKLTTPTPNYSGMGFFGAGVNVETVKRQYNEFLDNELLNSRGQLARYDVFAPYAAQIDQLLSDRNSGLTTALSAFFGSVNEVANDPTSLATRQVMLAAGRNLAGRLNNMGNVLGDMKTTINQELGSIASQVNTYASQIADLNRQILAVETPDSPANDLRDQRDQVVSDLNKLVNVKVLKQSSGLYNVYIGNGMPLVVDTRYNTLSAATDPADPTLQTPIVTVGTTAFQLNSTLVTGGRLGGLLALRENLLLPAEQELGRIAIGLADQFNAQHANGFDLNGVAGGNFFNPASGLIRKPAAYSTNGGTGAITATLTNSNQLTSSDYELSYDGANYTLTRLSDGQQSPPGALGAVTTINGQAQGFTLALSAGAPAAGDRWLIRLTADGAKGFGVSLTDPSAIAAAGASTAAPGDNSNALALAGLQTGLNMGNSTATYEGLYRQVVSRTATLAGEADTAQKAYGTLSQQALDAQQSLSGVNLDEEAANLIRYQQAYQASAKAMQIASTLLDDILSIGR